MWNNNPDKHDEFISKGNKDDGIGFTKEYSLNDTMYVVVDICMYTRVYLYCSTFIYKWYYDNTKFLNAFYSKDEANVSAKCGPMI